MSHLYATRLKSDVIFMYTNLKRNKTDLGTKIITKFGSFCTANLASTQFDKLIQIGLFEKCGMIFMFNVRVYFS